MDEVNFGWLPEKETYALPEFRIEPADDFDQALATVRAENRIEDDWFYPPLVDDEPKPAEWFKLPFTHKLFVVDETVGRHRLSTFLVFVLGFLKGIRLIPEPWVHVYRVPTRPHQLQDFYVFKADVMRRVLRQALEFWQSSDVTVKTRMLGALHWHSLGRTYERPYEVFNAQYTVLDTCWNIHVNLGGKPTLKNGPNHTERVKVLAEACGVHLPEWAVVHGKKSYLSQLRNDLLHEALWAGEPIGLSHPKDYPTIHLELYYFNSRLILALLGDKSEYTRQPMNMYAMTDLD